MWAKQGRRRRGEGKEMRRGGEGLAPRFTVLGLVQPPSVRCD